MNKHIALLRGINVGGNHKVPMKELSSLMKSMGFESIQTLLNSGNVIFENNESSTTQLETMLENKLQQHFGFPIPVIVRKAEDIVELFQTNPFENMELTSDIRQYVTFLKEQPKTDITLPWKSDDNSFTILEVNKGNIVSVLDLSKTKTPKGMEALEKIYGKNITTRNWNTVVKIVEKLIPST